MGQRPSSFQTARKLGAGLSLSDYLQKILTAKVYDVAIETPLEPAKSLSRRLGHHVLLKREDLNRCSASSCAGPITAWPT